MIARMRRALAVTWRAGRGRFVGYVLLAPLAGLLPVVAALLTRRVLDRVVDASAGAVLGAAAALAVASVGLAVVPHLLEYVRAEVGRSAATAALDELYAGTERLNGLRRLEEPAFQNTLSLAEQAGRDGPGRCLDGALGLVQGGVLLGGFVAALAVLSPAMALVVGLSGVPALLAELRLSRRRAGMLWRLSPGERREMFYAGLLTNLSAAKEVRLLGLGGLFRRRMLAEVGAANAARRRHDRREVRTQGLLAVLSAALAGVGLVWAVVRARAGDLSVGDVAMFVAAVAGVQQGVAGLVGHIAGIHQALLLLRYYEDVVTCAPDLPVPAAPRPIGPLRRGIEFRDVWFRYGDDRPWVLRGVTFTVPCGQSIGLVGHNGAGKSTVVKLLCRFYDPTRGAILWDGVDLRDVEPKALRARIGAVFQDYVTYDLTAAENIWLGDVGDRDAVAPEDLPALRDAARRAGVHDTLAGLPNGYDTMLSRTFELGGPDDDEPAPGVLLSGGQWQRLAIARGVLPAGRDLLVLDEPSAGLDAEAEHDLHHRLRAYRAGRTSVLISHRLGTLRDADHIVVLDGGVVAEAGDHDTLLALAGRYAALFDKQAEGYRASLSSRAT
ncbi:ABC transporter ATP-binding protein [Virgisporangium aurantiacum]|uniref:Multidrug ABC transporter permease n=1 Tax=Virgisporangium aurantiacum TaxID=175570 RepID=A0A8J3Z3W7_9ACTN|nr:ABC transporter ATP-binding protein [Virgisporangium aurantiacum]GIJ56849.1 multidrug ABC transporter permease [Virgisporangium aurantiacum]